MTINWPSSLSTKLMSVSGYQESVLGDPSVRSSMDSGPPKSRSRYTAIAKQITGTLDTLTSGDVDNLLDFWETTCGMGTLPFVWAHPRTGNDATFIWMKYPDVTPSNNSPTIFVATLELVILP